MNQEQARIRNWQKARIIGSHIHTNDKALLLTKSEQKIANKINELKQKLIDNWDENSQKISGKTYPKYQCWCCKRRTNVAYVIDYGSSKVHHCKKHFMEFIDEEHPGTINGKIFNTVTLGNE